VAPCRSGEGHLGYASGDAVSISFGAWSAHRRPVYPRGRGQKGAARQRPSVTDIRTLPRST